MTDHELAELAEIRKTIADALRPRGDDADEMAAMRRKFALLDIDQYLASLEAKYRDVG